MSTVYDQPGTAPSEPDEVRRSIDDAEKKSINAKTPSRSKPEAKESKKAAPDRNELGAQEQAPAGGSASRASAASSSDTQANQVGRGYKQTASGSSWLFKNRRKMAILGAAGGLIIIPLILFLAILFPSLKLPQLAAEIEGYRLARLSRSFYRNASTLSADQAAVEAGGESATVDDLVGKTALGKAFNTFRPNKVISNMKATGTLGFEFGEGAAGTQKLTAVILNGKKIDTPTYNYRSPGDLINNYRERLNFASQIRGGVSEALGDSNYLVRSSVSKELLSSYGINLLWFEKLGMAFNGDTEQQADVQELRDSEAKIETPSTDPLKTAALEKSVEEGEEAQATCLANDACAEQAVEDNGLPPEVTDAIDKGTAGATGGALNDFINVVNPVYGAAFPVCLIYDGSTDASNAIGFLNSQNAAATKTFFAVASAADQEKSGDITAEAAGAMNRQIGDIATSIPGEIAQNGSASTSDEVSPQAGRSGTFSIFNVIFGGSLGSVANSIAGTACPAVTNTTLALSLGVLNLGLGLITLGEANADEEAVGEAATTAVDNLISGIVKTFTSKEGISAIRNSSQKYAIDAAQTGAKISATSYLAHMIVLSEMGSFISGMDSSDFASQADMGGTAYGNQMEQTQQFGRPLTPTETTGVEQADQSYTVATRNQTESAFDKYLAISNPYSVAGKMAMSMSGWKFSDIGSFFTDFSKIFSTILSPLSHFGIAHAASSSVNSDYGMVQFGWSNDEENLIDNDPTYDPLINAEILQDSGKEPAIARMYAACFGYSSDSSGNLTFNQEDQIGNLIGGSSPKIPRDSDGNVLDPVNPQPGDCTPSNLGPQNTSFDDNLCAGDPALANVTLAKGNSCNDLVFRWRVDEANQNTLGELEGIQNPTATAATGTTSSGGTTTAPGGGGTTSSGGSTTTVGTVDEGTNAQLAQKLLNYRSSGQYTCDNAGDCTDLEKIVNGQSLAGSDGCQAQTLDPRVLQLLLYLIEVGNFKIGTFAMCGDHSFDSSTGHSGGFAVDISSVNGASLGQNTPQAATEGLAMDQYLNNLPASLQLNQQISYGYGGQYDASMAAHQQFNGQLCGDSCVSIYTLTVEQEHEDHIHAGY